MPDPKGDSNVLMKKWGPLPIAAYVVAGVALVGFMLIGKKKSSGNATGSNIQPAPAGINDPTTDQNAQLVATLNDINTALSKIVATSPTSGSSTGTAGTTGTATGESFDAWWQRRFNVSFRPSGRTLSQWVNDLLATYERDTGRSRSGDPQAGVWSYAKFGTTYAQLNAPGPQAQGPKGLGGGEAPVRILPDTFMRTPRSLNAEMTRHPAVLSNPR